MEPEKEKDAPVVPEPEKEPTKEEGQDPEPEKEPEHIDYKKELETLETEDKKKDKPQFTEREKAEYNLKRNADKLREHGGDPAKVLGVEKGEVPADAVSKRELDLRFKQQDARARARSDDEYKLMMWYIENRDLSVDEAHLLANKGKVLRSEDEIKRSQVRIQGGTDTGQKIPAKKEVSILSAKAQQDLAQKGFKKNADGSFEGRYIKLVPEGNRMVEYKRVLGKKDEWEKVRGVSETE